MEMFRTLLGYTATWSGFGSNLEVGLDQVISRYPFKCKSVWFYCPTCMAFWSVWLSWPLSYNLELTVWESIVISNDFQYDRVKLLPDVRLGDKSMVWRAQQWYSTHLFRKSFLRERGTAWKIPLPIYPAGLHCFCEIKFPKCAHREPGVPLYASEQQGGLCLTWDPDSQVHTDTKPLRRCLATCSTLLKWMVNFRIQHELAVTGLWYSTATDQRFVLWWSTVAGQLAPPKHVGISTALSLHLPSDNDLRVPSMFLWHVSKFSSFWEVVRVVWILRIVRLSFEISDISKLDGWMFRRDTVAFSTDLSENLFMTVKHILLQF